ncbi:SRPBCC family protein [Streptomyces sp. NPDC049577]|uniref:SRPBCC family protein n=1 Tax=Streptomyces sp. NPDC049577 TaxID=3155153 RepID=UPI003438929F
MALHRYRFRSTWVLPAPPDTVYALLAAADDYPDWWPQIRATERTGPTSGNLRLRSFLPYDLRLTLRETRADPHRRVLECAVEGDLEGWARWTVEPRGPHGSTARFRQEVEARKPLLRRWAVPARPLFVAAHTWAMRGGRRGLRSRLEHRRREI